MSGSHTPILTKIVSVNVVVLICLLASSKGLATTYMEPPVLKSRVEAGQLPPVRDRLPKEPFVVDLAAENKQPGNYGGTLKTMMGREKDTRMMVVYGYARLVGYGPDWALRPDILARVDNDGDRSFTFHLRPGHKWSDGAPFTSEDFRYVWDDVLTNEEMSPGGLPAFLLVDGRPPVFEVIDEVTVRYTWDKPNRGFLPALAGARPEYLYLPAHFLKPFHAKYAEPEALKAKIAEEGQRNWIALHFRKAQPYKNDDPELPSLQPWILETAPPSNLFSFRRNPYFHRVDPTGKQLPYIDEVKFTVVNSKLIPAKAAAGDSDLQARGLGFENYAILKQGEEDRDFKVRLWRSAAGSEMALYPNLNVTDSNWQMLIRNADFRRALSLGINREEINQTIYFGLAETGNNTVLKESPLYKSEFAQAWTEFDTKKAAALLDQIGLSNKDDRGVRLLPDGRPAEIIVETAGEDPTETDILQLIRDTWTPLGIKLHIKPLQREVFRNRIFAGETLLAIWKGMENAVPTADMVPFELAPTHQMQYAWPKWGLYAETRGQAGEEIDLDAVQELAALFQKWEQAPDSETRRDIWQQMLAIHAEQQFTIGIVRGVPQPVVVNLALRNVPESAIYNWEPGAHFGVHRPDTFWFAR